MSVKISRQKDLLYHRATFLVLPGKTLEEHVDGAWKKLGLASQRAQKIGGDQENIRV